MNAVQIFDNPEFGVIRTLVVDEAPWWVGKDVAKALKYNNTNGAIRDHVDKEDKSSACELITRGSETLPPGVQSGTLAGGMQPRTILINESGLYSLILSSKLESAKRFKRWVTSEVLPALRRSGKYDVKSTDSMTVEQRTLTVDDYIKAASIVAACKNERMPIVLALIERGGIEIPKLRDIEEKALSLTSYETSGETAALINLAINDYGIKQARIAKLCGLHPTIIRRILNGQSRLTHERAAIIRDAVNSEIDRINEATK